MRMLYDTTAVHPLDRYEHYRAGAASEQAPVEVHGRAPTKLVASMSVSRVGEFDVEGLTWAADTEIMTRRTDRLVRMGDPERYRLIMPLAGEIRLEQEERRLRFRVGDIGLFDLSRPWRAVHPVETGELRVAMLTFPRALVPVDERAVGAIVGTVMPRGLRARDLTAQLLMGLSAAAEPAQYAGLLAECTTGLIRRRVGLRDGITPQTRRMLSLTRVRDAVRRHLHEPDLDPLRVARASNLSPRSLHGLFAGTGVTPMQLVKQMRLDECHRRLTDPGERDVPVFAIAAQCGYRRRDQFARDFRQAFAVSPTGARRGDG
ncbi:helix-turn-helix domain-containing protein [Dactylosporangium sp. CA-139114]|uniref:helix-turn-helix domain-containing protein n=1 Tax=Dactylosporangium sp. CA-139114 TaxID=3239931 RepID=UPI003D987412